MQHFVLMEIKEAADSQDIVGVAIFRTKKFQAYHSSVMHVAKDKSVTMIGWYGNGSL